MNDELRCFTFGNFMLSSIQQGIQGAHAIAEMFTKYAPGTEQGDILYNWANNHKTLVVKNGGDDENVREIFNTCTRKDNWYPFASFTESKGALFESMTSVAIVLPEYIYDSGVSLLKDRNVLFSYSDITKLWNAKNDLNGEITQFTQFDFDIMTVLKHSRLAY